MAADNTPSSEPVRVFISYAAADSVIAETLYETLTEVDRKRVNCFLDTKSIPAGMNFQTALDEALESADWLVCIYTGEESQFVGYEIGVFSKSCKTNGRRSVRRMVCLHDVEEMPGLYRNHQNHLVQFRDPSTSLDDVAFYKNVPLARFFRDFYKFEDLYVTKDVTEADRQLQTLVQQVKNVTAAFKAAQGTDVRFDTPTQLRVEIAIAPPVVEPLTRIPDDARVTGTYQSLALVKLMPPMREERLPSTTWSQVRAACSLDHKRVPPWMERLERDVVDAANQRVLSGVEATFASHGKIYRTILARHLLYENGSRKFEVLFVETLPRQFLGRKNTSLILAGLVLASRFRFSYLEEPAKTRALFDDSQPDETFESHCWQFNYDLDRLQHEAIELGLLDREEFIKAFGEDKRGFAVKLLDSSAESWNRVLDALPPHGEHIRGEKRLKVRDAILSYLREVEPLNMSFITAAIEVYGREMNQQFSRRTAAEKNGFRRMEPID